MRNDSNEKGIAMSIMTCLLPGRGGLSFLLLLSALGASSCDWLKGSSRSPCESSCQKGEKSCGLAQVLLECVGPNSDGCTFWQPGDPCAGGEICVQGACAQPSASPECVEHLVAIDGACACADPCTAGTAACNQGTGLMRCQGPDTNGCFFWGPPEPCEQGQECKAELVACVPTRPASCAARDECAYEGQKVCMTDIKYRQCKYDADGCLILDCST